MTFEFVIISIRVGNVKRIDGLGKHPHVRPEFFPKRLNHVLKMSQHAFSIKWARKLKIVDLYFPKFRKITGSKKMY